MLADTVVRPGGIGRYTRELLGALGRRTDVRLLVAAPADAADAVARLAGPTLIDHIVIPGSRQLSISLWERHRAGAALQRGGAELVHGTKHLVPRGPMPSVLTVHDLMTITRADENSLPKRVLLPREFRASLRQATRLAAVSQATAAGIAAIDPSWSAKTVVVLNGLSRGLLEAEPDPLPDIGDRRFALVVGDLSPRKNVAMLLDIWPTVAAIDPDLLLLVVGHDGPHSEATRARLAELEALGIARWVQGAGDEHLRWCYEHATIVLFPTLEEGFGLPLIEALAFHAPVIASTDPALVEVGAGAAGVRHLDPGDRDAWREAVLTAAAVPRPAPTPPTLEGHATWDDHAEGMVALYREVVVAPS